MESMQSALQKAFDLVDRRENAAALKIVTDLLAKLAPPDRVGDIPPARPTKCFFTPDKSKTPAAPPGTEISPPARNLPAPPR